MITLFYQSEFEIPNSIPPHLRSKDEHDFKSVKPKFITEICNYLNIPYRQVTKETWKGEPAYYHIELEWIDQALIYRNVFEWIDKDVLELIKNPDSNLRLLIWFPNEGFSLRMKRFIEIIDFCLKDLDIPGNKTYFVFGDINIRENFLKYQRKLGLKEIRTYGFDSFETTYHNECRMLESDGHTEMFPREENRIQNLNKNRSKRFIFRNANPREHRLYFAAELKRRNLLNISYYSWLNRYFIPQHTTEEIKKHFLPRYSNDLEQYDNIAESLINFLKDSPYILDYGADVIGNDLNQRKLMPNIFSDSYFTFVTETTFYNYENENVLFVTEKIYQPIVQYHPFIVAACPETLAYMRKYGYQTFPELFDESYDQEYDLKKRTKMIVDNIERVSNMPQKQLHEIYYSEKFQQKLIHNKKLFIEGKGKSKWEEVIKWLDH